MTVFAAADLGTKRKRQNTNVQNPNTKNAPPSPTTNLRTPNTEVSVAFHTLAFCPWHSERIPWQHPLKRWDLWLYSSNFFVTLKVALESLVDIVTRLEFR